MKAGITDPVEAARAMEQQNRLEEAATLYEEALKNGTKNEQAYQRLMIVYRKLKRPDDELRVIRLGIRAFESLYVKKSKSRKLTSLSNALLKSTGLADAKGKLLYAPEPIPKWKKRKEMLEKKLKK